MYFITALACTIISIVLLFFFKDRKRLHLPVLSILFGAATIMWLVDCIASSIKGEGFFSFEEIDGWIALYTLIGGLFFWLLVSFVLNNKEKVEIVNSK